MFRISPFSGPHAPPTDRSSPPVNEFGGFFDMGRSAMELSMDCFKGKPTENHRFSHEDHGAFL